MDGATRAPRSCVWLGVPIPSPERCSFRSVCKFILEDLLQTCDPLRRQAIAGKVVHGINCGHVFSLTNKRKTLDVAIGIGTPDTTKESVPGIYQGSIASLLLS